ncbi:MAG: HD domain-containing protein, partial [Dehalococcoidia bacterium]|nr:HD domain-containing protein [Dehalococcoidia bacterium]
MNGQPDTLLQTTVIAALLHDIGVVAQRAQDPAQPTTDHAPLAAAFAAARAPAPFRAASAAILGHHRPDDRATRIVAAA